MEQIIILLIFGAAAALQGWLKSRKGESEDSDWDQPSPTTRNQPPPVRKPAVNSDWEAELKRLLEGTQPPVAPKPPPTPVIVTRTVPPPVPASKPAPVRVPAPDHKWLVPKPLVDDEEGPETLALANLHVAADAYGRASQLHERTAERLSKVNPDHGHTYKGRCSRCEGKIEFPISAVGSTVTCPHCSRETRLAVMEADPHLAAARVIRKRRSQEAEAAVAMVRSRPALRQAIIASVILGPPKALEV